MINNKHNFKILISIQIILFVVTRLVFYVYFPVPEFGRDSYGYFEPLIFIHNGLTPIFNIRTPGYPLFLIFVNFLGSIKWILLTQSLFSLAVSSYMLWLINKRLPKYTFIVFITLCINCISPGTIHYETSIITEFLYTNLLLLCITTFTIAFLNKNNKIWVLFSVFLGLMIITRPQGVFVIPILIITILYLLYFNRIREIIPMIIPVILIMTVLMCYNLITYKRFNLTDLGALNNLGSSITYIEKSKDYPENVNKAIDENFKYKQDIQLKKVKSTCNTAELSKIFSQWDTCFTFYSKINSIYTGSYLDFYNPINIAITNKIINKIATDAKFKHPDVYLKFIYNGFVRYNSNLCGDFYFYYNSIINRSKWIRNKNEMLFNNPNSVTVNFVFKEYKGVVFGNNLPDYFMQLNDETLINKIKKQNFLIRFSHYKDIIYNFLFRNELWVIMFYLMYLMNIVYLVITKFKIREVFLLWNIGNFLLFSCLLVSLVQYPICRLSYPTEVIYYFYVITVTWFLLLKLFPRIFKTIDSSTY